MAVSKRFRAYSVQLMFIILTLLYTLTGHTRVYSIDRHSDIIGEVQVITAVYEDTFVALSRIYNVGFDEVVAANPKIDPWFPGEGAKIIIPSQHILPPGPRKGIVINLPEMRLYYYLPNGKQVLTHPVGIGKETWPTPTTKTRIVNKRINPTWRVPESIYKAHLAQGNKLPRIVPPGSDNPLGRYALNLGLAGYLIHSTNRPPGVGQRISHGCIRMYPEDIQALFDRVPVGTPVRIIHEPFKAGWHKGQLYLESHQPLIEYRNKASISAAKSTIKSAMRKKAFNVDWKIINVMTNIHSGIPHFTGRL